MALNRIIKVNSHIGLRQSGVERAPSALLAAGLDQLQTAEAPVDITPPAVSSSGRHQSGILNADSLYDISLQIGTEVGAALDDHQRPIVLGGDCSILIGITAELKRRGRYGVISFDAHADFYEPHQSPTGEAADMDIALITGRSDDRVVNIHHGKPYILDQDVIHIGQRDQTEAQAYGSTSLQNTMIKRLDLDHIQRDGITAAQVSVTDLLLEAAPDHYWLHIDTDVLHDDDNPAVDYRLPDGLRFDELEKLLEAAFLSGKIIGLSIAIYNPALDPNSSIARHIASMITKVLEVSSS